MKYPMSKSQKEIYDYIIEFYKEYPTLTPSLRDMCSGRVGDKQVCKARTGREGARKLVKSLCDKGCLEERFYRNVAYWVPADG